MTRGSVTKVMEWVGVVNRGLMGHGQVDRRGARLGISKQRRGPVVGIQRFNPVLVPMQVSSWPL